MNIGRTSDQPILRVPHPQLTARWRLTLLYSVLFLICGATLLAITYWLFTKFAFGYYPPKPTLPLYGTPPNPAIVAFAEALSKQRSIDLHRLQVGYGVALGIMALVSAVLAWLAAGRVLAPLRTITATAQRISGTNLHERLATDGCGGGSAGALSRVAGMRGGCTCVGGVKTVERSPCDCRGSRYYWLESRRGQAWRPRGSARGRRPRRQRRTQTGPLRRSAWRAVSS